MIISVSQNNNKVEAFDLNDLISAEVTEAFSFFIGRAQDCTICLDDKKISRNHCEVKYIAGNWHVKKISNFNELILNGKNVSESIISPGDILEIASFQLEFNFEKLNSTSKDTTHETLKNDVNEEVSNSIEMDNADQQTNLDSLDENTEKIDLENEEIEGSNDQGESLDQMENEHLSGSENSEEVYDEYAESGNTEGEYSSDDSSMEDYGEADAQEGEFAEDNYDMEESGGEKTQVFTGFADYDLEIFGEYAPYDKYSIKDGETIIGRDEENVDIFLHDSEVSSKHAKIVKTKISLRLIDLNSGNGTLLNGSRVNESDLQSGDEFIIGSTTFTVHIRSDLIASEKGRMLPVEENQVVEVEEIVEVEEKISEDAFGSENEEEVPKSLFAKLIYNYKKLPPAKQRIYGIIGIVILGMLLMDSDEPEQAAAPNKKPGAEKAVAKDGTSAAPKKAVMDVLDKLTLQEREVVASKYQLAFEFIQQGKYSESLNELDYVMKLAPDYKQARSLYQMASEGLAKLEELEKKRLAEIEMQKRQDKVKTLLVKAQQYVKDRQAQAAEGIFSKILEIDPENFDVPQLKLEIDAWKREQERIAVEKAQKDADRKRKLSQIAPSRTVYGKEEWYKAILRIEEFLRIKDMDEDLVQEATKMLKESKQNLKNKLDPLVGKARSLKEGQDLKAAYEQYLEILKYEPTNVEALDELNNIRDMLTFRSQKVYRDGLISESLMLYKEAKEKFQEVQQISPSDSEYYKKASLKLREYLE